MPVLIITPCLYHALRFRLKVFGTAGRTSTSSNRLYLLAIKIVYYLFFAQFCVYLEVISCQIPALDASS